MLDPKASQADPIVPGVQVMREVLTILGPTLDGSSATARREWCINTMAADPARKSILANNEDGVLYRWDLTTNTLSQNLRLNAGLGQAYTPTLVGADGAVYAISNATLYSIRATRSSPHRRNGSLKRASVVSARSVSVIRKATSAARSAAPRFRRCGRRPCRRRLSSAGPS